MSRFGRVVALSTVEKSMAHAVDGREELRDVIPGFTGVDQKWASVIKLGNYATPLTVDTLKPMADAAVRTGLLEEVPDLADLIWKP